MKSHEDCFSRPEVHESDFPCFLGIVKVSTEMLKPPKPKNPFFLTQHVVIK